MIHALWFIPFTVVNVLIWKFIPCEWHYPYQEIEKMKFTWTRFYLILAALFVLFMGAVGVAQTTTPVIKSNEPFSLLGDYTDTLDAEATGFRLYVNGMPIQTAGREVLSNGIVEFAGIRLGKGTYTLAISAFNESGESMSLPLGTTILPGNPTSPRNLRIVKVEVR